MSRIIYCGSFRFPDGDAAAARVLGIGKALAAAGHEMIFSGWEQKSRKQDRQPDGTHIYQGFRYYSQNDFRTQDLDPLQRALGYLTSGRNTLGWMKTLPLGTGDVVVAYNGGTYFLTHLAALCRARNARLLLDCTEWYSPAQLPGGIFGLPFWDSEIRVRRVSVSIGRVIAISSFLEDYFKHRGCNVVRIPPLIDIREPKWSTTTLTEKPATNELRLAYAGTPGRKDLLGNVLRGLAMALTDGLDVRLCLIGPSREQTATCLGGDSFLLKKLENKVDFTGRVAQASVPSWLKKSEFSVLLRPSHRYAQAGFPTKLVESLGSGVPVIANATSDIAEFVRDGQEGVLLPGCTPRDFAAGLRRLATLPHVARQAMRDSARRRAEEAFDFRRYVEVLHDFVLGGGGDSP